MASTFTTKRWIDNGGYHVQIVPERWSSTDAGRLARYAPETVALGGAFEGTVVDSDGDTESVDFTLPDNDVLLRSDFNFYQVFTVDEFDDAARPNSLFWAQEITTRLTAALTALRAIDDTGFTSQSVSEI